MKSLREIQEAKKQRTEKKYIDSIMSKSGCKLKDSFIRNNFQDVIHHVKASLKKKTKKRITSWTQFSKLIIRFRT